MSVPPQATYVPPPRLPIGVAILGALTILVGILILLAALALLIAPLFLVGLGFPLPFGLAAGVLGLIVLLIAILWIATGVGLIRLRSWAWWLAVIVMVLSILSSLAAPALALVPFLILVYLIVVRHHFR